MSDINMLHRVIVEYTRNGRCAVCKRESGQCSDVGACAQRSIPASSRKNELLRCKLCSVKLYGKEYSGHIGACLAEYQRLMGDIVVGRMPSTIPDASCLSGTSKRIVVARASGAAPPGQPGISGIRSTSGATTTKKSFATSTMKSQGTTHQAVFHRETGRSARASPVSVGTQTSKKTTCNSSTQTKKLCLVPGAPLDFVKWEDPHTVENLLDEWTLDDGQAAEPLIALPTLNRDLLILDVKGASESESPIHEELEKGSGILTELDPFHSTSRKTEAESQAITDDLADAGTGLGPEKGEEATATTSGDSSDSEETSDGYDDDTASSFEALIVREPHKINKDIGAIVKDINKIDEPKEPYGMSPYLRHSRRGTGRGRPGRPVYSACE